MLFLFYLVLAAIWIAMLFGLVETSTFAVKCAILCVIVDCLKWAIESLK